MPKRGKVSSVVYINMYMFTAGKYALVVYVGSDEGRFSRV